MSYEKQNFVDGQTLTAAQLNHTPARRARKAIRATPARRVRKAIRATRAMESAKMQKSCC